MMEQPLRATVWMGGIESHMDEEYVIEAFKNMGFTAISVKEIFHKTTNERANYCFVDFGDVSVAAQVLHSINNEPIPGSKGKKFNLNRSEYGRSSGSGGCVEYSMFVGDLTNEVTDDMLLDFFKLKYPSVRAAKVVKDAKGAPKGYGFARFYDKSEYENALTEMQSAKGLGQRPIRVNKASKSKNEAVKVEQDPSTMYPGWMQMQMQYMQQMHQYMHQCQQFAQEAANYAANGGTGNSKELQVDDQNHNESSSLMSYVQQQHDQLVAKAAEMDEDVDLVYPDSVVDVAALNQEIIDRDDKLFFELEASRWDFSNSFLNALQQRPMKAS